MGRITVPAKADTGLEIFVGWDRPLETYFATVLRPGDEDDETVVWTGTRIGEITDSARIVAAIEAYAEVPADLCSRLEADRLASVGTPDSPHQAAVKRLFVR